MELVLFVLALGILLGMTVKKVGLNVYVTVFICSIAASMVFLVTYFRLHH
ncbi:MAG: hypothetical protein FWE94_05320 [Coriobacteriia bacterium]|nr:hypothetical protein [Coriobacteriia bacterium]